VKTTCVLFSGLNDSLGSKVGLVTVEKGKLPPIQMLPVVVQVVPLWYCSTACTREGMETDAGNLSGTYVGVAYRDEDAGGYANPKGWVS
jgi:hypothetical protein